MTAGPDVPLLGAGQVRALAGRLGLRPTKQCGPELRRRRQHRAAIVRLAGVGAGRQRGRGRPRAGVADPGPAAREPGTSPPSRSTRCSPAQLPETVADRTPRRCQGRLTTVQADALTRAPAARPAADRPRGQPALQRRRARRADLPRAVRRRSSGSWSWCSSRSPSGSPPARARAPTACRASRRPGTPTCGWSGAVPRSVFWPVPNVDSGLVSLVRRRAAAQHGKPRGGLRLRRRGVRPAPQDPAGRAGVWAGGAGRCRGGAARCRGRPVAHGASSSTSPPSRRIAARGVPR